MWVTEERASGERRDGEDEGQRKEKESEWGKKGKEGDKTERQRTVVTG